MGRPPMRALESGPAVNWLFVDLNAYFASVEQQERPELRGRPVAVAQVMTPNTVCIAASYQAKPYGVKTGVKVGEAQRLCPELQMIVARPKLYVEYHQRLMEAIERVLPIDEVLSIDEAACRLSGMERWLPNAQALARAVKEAVREVGDVLTCSVGLAPSRYLAKVASDMQKPDGLTTLLAGDLPQALYGLELRDLPGVGPRTAERLQAQGIGSVEQLCARSRAQMRQLWGGVWGERMWHWLRGEDFDPPSSGRHSLGRQHVLPPELRHRDDALAVARKLLDSAAAELRRQRLWARGLGVGVQFPGRRGTWRREMRIEECQDSFRLQALLGRLWEECPAHAPLMVSVWLGDVAEEDERTPGLFDGAGADGKSGRASAVMDEMNRRYGANTLYPASLHGSRTAARRGIAFRKVPGLEQF